MAHYHGHRKRLRERFLKQGLDGFQDYEALELLLFSAIPRRDTKPIAKALVDRFGSFKEVLDATPEELQEVKGVGEVAASAINLVKWAAARYLQQSSREHFSPQDATELHNYCIVHMGALPNERFRVICLDSNFAIVHEEDIADGTIDQATVYPRKVMETALKAKASTLVFVHNHPDGGLTPSKFDETITRSLVLAAKTMGVTVYDHIIVSRDGYYSFRENGLL